MHKLRYNLHKNNNCTGSTYLKDKKRQIYLAQGLPVIVSFRNEISVKKCMEYRVLKTQEMCTYKHLKRSALSYCIMQSEHVKCM